MHTSMHTYTYLHLYTDMYIFIYTNPRFDYFCPRPDPRDKVPALVGTGALRYVVTLDTGSIS